MVADEVRSLAKRTGDATHEIELLVEAIQAETAQAKNQIQTVAINSEKFSEMGAEAQSQMDEMIEISGSMESIINTGGVTQLLGGG
ncbi:MAG: hypothetical protein COB89_03350 [Piscirickettsiaceae bacterium]|nr:MAG: hypothetical protein COB89_03350 [Piscirickettsiaceae bacterium]